MEPISAASSTLRLRDGRALGCLDVGRKGGSPIFHFHGLVSSRLEVLLIASAATSLGVRLIGLDRPGVGRSDPRDGFQILDWPDDVVEAADQLGLERFAVEGFSAGAAYAMACAYRIPHRLTACGLVSPVAPGPFAVKDAPWLQRATYWVGDHSPSLLRNSIGLLRFLIRSSPGEASMEKLLTRVSAVWPASDRALVDNPESRRNFASALAEGLRQGAKAAVEEGVALVRPWGFKVEEITFERMFLWHGEQDRIVPVAGSRSLAKALPNCAAVFYPDEGHLATLMNHLRDIWGVHAV